ncbi:MAG TPA: L-seryl-tRNA(Sec) selenium transferase, partial [Acidimicrobiia bacterium]
MATLRPPSVDAVIRALRGMRAPFGLTAEIARAAVEETRERILRGEEVDTVAAARDALARALLPRLRPVINATGVLLHTNLGRAPLHTSAA